jgi:hypothetical protein
MITGDNDTCDKSPAITFFTGVVDTGQKYSKSLKLIAGVNDTSEKLFSGVNDTVQELSHSLYRHSTTRYKNSPTASIGTLNAFHSSHFSGPLQALQRPL